MKFFYSCAFLVTFFAACQASPLLGLRFLVSPAVDTGKNLAGGVVENVVLVTSDLRDIAGIVNDITAVVANFVAETLAKPIENVFKVYEVIRTESANIKPTLLTFNQDIANKAREVLQDFSGQLIEQIEELINGIKDVEGTMIETKKKLIEDASEEIIALLNSTIEQIESADANVIQLINILEQFSTSMYKHIDNLLKNVMVLAKEGAKEIRDNISEIRKDIGSMVQQIIDLLFGNLSNRIGVLVDNVKSIVDRIFNVPAS